MPYQIRDANGDVLWFESTGGDGSAEAQSMTPQSAYSEEILEALRPSVTEGCWFGFLSGGGSFTPLGTATGTWQTLYLSVQPVSTDQTTLIIDSDNQTKFEQVFNEDIIGYSGPIVIQMEPQSYLRMTAQGPSDLRIVLNYREVFHG